MATISHEVADYRKKDGTYAIRIRLIHNRKAIRKPSGIFTGAITKYIQSMFKVDTKLTRRGRLASDVFRLSFCLVGMNTADLYGLKKSDLRDGVLTR